MNLFESLNPEINHIESRIKMIESLTNKEIGIYNMFESVNDELSAQDMSELKNLLNTTKDVSTISSFLQSKLVDNNPQLSQQQQESLNEVFVNKENVNHELQRALENNIINEKDFYHLVNNRIRFEINPEDVELFLDGIQEYEPIKNIESVTYGDNDTYLVQLKNHKSPVAYKYFFSDEEQDELGMNGFSGLVPQGELSEDFDAEARYTPYVSTQKVINKFNRLGYKIVDLLDTMRIKASRGQQDPEIFQLKKDDDTWNVYNSEGRIMFNLDESCEKDYVDESLDRSDCPYTIAGKPYLWIDDDVELIYEYGYDPLNDDDLSEAIFKILDYTRADLRSGLAQEVFDNIKQYLEDVDWRYEEDDYEDEEDLIKMPKFIDKFINWGRKDESLESESGQYIIEYGNSPREPMQTQPMSYEDAEEIVDNYKKNYWFADILPVEELTEARTFNTDFSTKVVNQDGHIEKSDSSGEQYEFATEEEAQEFINDNDIK